MMTKNRPNVRFGAMTPRGRPNLRGAGFWGDLGKTLVTGGLSAAGAAGGSAAGTFLGGPVGGVAGGAGGAVVGGAAGDAIGNELFGKGMEAIDESLGAKLHGFGLAPRSLDPKANRRALNIRSSKRRACYA